MKNKTPTLSPPDLDGPGCGAGPAFWLRPLLVLGLLGCTIPDRLHAQQLEVGVRAKVINPYPEENIEPGQERMEHGKIYSVKSVKRVPAEWNLVKAVDEGNLRHLTELFLNASGFRESGYSERPEIVITVVYGRGYPLNPYLLDKGASNPWMKGGSGSDVEGKVTEHIDFPTVVVTGGSRQVMSEMSAGYQTKVQKADAEKLLIQITAWDNPIPGLGANRKLWSTTMVVDDPDHRDLNVVAGKMLQAGAPYFGRAIKEGEVESHQSLPDGRVKLGEPHAVDPQPKDK